MQRLGNLEKLFQLALVDTLVQIRNVIYIHEVAPVALLRECLVECLFVPVFWNHVRVRRMRESQKHAVSVLAQLEMPDIARRRAHDSVEKVHVAIQLVERNFSRFRQFLQQGDFPLAPTISEIFRRLISDELHSLQRQVKRNEELHSLLDFANFHMCYRFIRLNLCVKSLVQRVEDVDLAFAQHVVHCLQVYDVQRVLVHEVRNLRPHVEQLDVATAVNLICERNQLVVRLRRQHRVRQLACNFSVNLLNRRPHLDRHFLKLPLVILL